MFGTDRDKIPGVWAKRADAVIQADDAADFTELFEFSGLDSRRHLRLADWSCIDFSGCVLRDFDFSGARLRDCNFSGALIDGARFDKAEINGTNLRAAKDWNAFVQNWTRPDRAVPDRYIQPLSVFQDAPFAPELVVVPPGRFMMGSPEDEEGRFDDEGRQHEATIPHRLAVGRYPVTFEEWDFAALNGMKGDRPEDQGWGRDRRPVINVSWKDAQAYVAWLRKKTGQAYRLLSEAEWEYCCRAGNQTRYSFGDDEERLGDYAWYSENADHKTHPVGEKKLNVWGLYDMHGNVDEWVEDVWHESYDEKPAELKANGGAWTSGDGDARVLRGGAWDNNPQNLRSAFRYGNSTDSRDIYDGFRIARTLTS